MQWFGTKHPFFSVGKIQLNDLPQDTNACLAEANSWAFAAPPRCVSAGSCDMLWPLVTRPTDERINGCSMFVDVPATLTTQTNRLAAGACPPLRVGTIEMLNLYGWGEHARYPPGNQHRNGKELIRCQGFVSCVSRVSVHHYASIQRSIRGIYPPPRLGLWEAEVAELQLAAESRATSNPSFAWLYAYTQCVFASV